MDTYSVSFHGLSASADAAARSMLRLLLPMLGGCWRIPDAGDSDVVILEDDTLAELRASGRALDTTLYIVFSREARPPSGAFAALRRPMNSARLVELLHLARDELDRRAALLGNTTSLATVVDRGATADETVVRTTMRAAIAWAVEDKSRAVVVRDRAGATILSVVPPLGFTTRLRSNNLAELVRTNAPVELVDMKNAHIDSLRSRRKFFPMSKLEWIYWLAGSNGKIRSGLMISRPYQLRRYPDFAVLPHYHGDVRMASLLKAEPLTVGELAQRAGVRLETACNFVNACWALGCLGDPGRAAPMKGTESDAPARQKLRAGQHDNTRDLRTELAA